MPDGEAVVSICKGRNSMSESNSQDGTVSQYSETSHEETPSSSVAGRSRVQKKAETLAVPGNDGFGLDDGQSRAPVAPQARQGDPEEAIACLQCRSLSDSSTRNIDLVARGQ